MKKYKRVIKITIVSLGLILLGLWVYFESHQPQLRGSVKIRDLNKDVEVYYDAYGIPHIYATEAEDAYRAFGYVHAADRLFQMELMRRVGSGRLSEIFGSDLIKADMFYRTLGTNRKAIKDAENFENLPPKIQAICKAYIAGVNDYIKNGKLPIEYKLLRHKPEEYTIEDMYAVAGYMAYSFAYALRTDPIVEKLNETLGYEYLKDLDMAYPNDSLWDLRNSVRKDSSVVWNDELKEIQPLAFLDKLPVPMLQGSNSWVVAPANTLSGKVIFANDTHIKYASPSVWYEAHIEFPGTAIYGNFLAGIPVALVGHTRKHAWGLTMFEDDDSDFFKEKFEGADSSATIIQTGTAPVIKHNETIRIKGDKDTTFTVYETIHGPIINTFLPVKSIEPVSMYWNYTDIENQLIQAFYTMNNAASMAIFKEGAEKVGSPGLNIAYGDASGNIAMWSASKLIKRPEGAYGKLYLNGFDSTGVYKGFYPFSDNPQYENPENGYIHSANNFHEPLSGDGYPGYYAPNERFDRIGNLLEESFPATIDGMKNVVLDVHSISADSITQEIVRVIKTSGYTLSNKENEALEYLANWDGNHAVTNIEPTIYYKVLFYTLRKAFADEMGDEMFTAFLNTHLFSRSYPKLIFNDDSKWWDHKLTTGKVEKRSGIMTESFKKAVADLILELGDDITTWEWGSVHTTTHKHAMGDVKILRSFLNVGPLPSPGGIETVNNASFIMNDKSKYEATYGPAMRILIDFADVENAVSILPTGNSGNPLSKHYKDQAEMYVNGEFRKMLMNKKEIVKQSSLLELKPK